MPVLSVLILSLGDLYVSKLRLALFAETNAHYFLLQGHLQFKIFSFLNYFSTLPFHLYGS